MTLEQENDFYILSYLNTKPLFSKKDVALFLALLPIDTDLFIKSQADKNFIEFKEDNILISKSGRFYLNWLASEKLKEELDAKIKKLTLNQATFQKVMTIASLSIAAIAILTPIILWKLDENVIKETKTQVPQLQQVLQKQDQLLKDLKGLKVVCSQDTSK